MAGSHAAVVATAAGTATTANTCVLAPAKTEKRANLKCKGALSKRAQKREKHAQMAIKKVVPLVNVRGVPPRPARNPARKRPGA